MCVYIYIYIYIQSINKQILYITHEVQESLGNDTGGHGPNSIGFSFCWFSKWLLIVCLP